MTKKYDIIEETTTTTTTVTKKVAKDDTAVPTLVTVVIDKSGSMDHLRDTVVNNFNEYIESLQEQDGECWVTLTTFDTQFNNVFVAKPLAEVPNLQSDDYNPGGLTALYDAVGHSVVDSEKELKKRGEKHDDIRSLCVIITDGQENSSREYDNKSIRTLISKKEDSGWTFVFLGAGIDAQQAATGLGIGIDPSTGVTRPGMYVNFQADAASYAITNATLSDATRRYRSAASSSTPKSFFDDTDAED